MAHKQERQVAYVLLLVGGILTLLSGLFALSASLFATSLLLSAAGFGALMMATGTFGALMIAAGALGVVCGALMIVAAMYINSTDANQIRTWSVIGLVFTLIGIVSGGGFVIGFILGLVGSIMGLTHKA